MSGPRRIPIEDRIDLHAFLPRETSRLLEDYLEEAVRAYAPRAAALGVAVECDLPDDAEAPVDARVFQVFCNVIKNAMDATGDGGTLAITMTAADGKCVIDSDICRCNRSTDTF